MKRMRKYTALLLALALLLGVLPAALADDAAKTLELTAEFEIPTVILPEGENGEVAAPAEGEGSEDTADEETGEEAEETERTEGVFTADVHIELVNTGILYFGDEVTLRAVVENANAPYELRWEVLVENEWTAIEDETKEEYTFVVTEENATSQYRVVVVAQVESTNENSGI